MILQITIGRIEYGMEVDVSDGRGRCSYRDKAQNRNITVSHLQ